MNHSNDFLGFPTHINGRAAPYEIHNPMDSQFSIARRYGGCRAFGTSYVWVQTGTTAWDAILVREDLYKARMKAATTTPRCEKTGDLFE